MKKAAKIIGGVVLALVIIGVLLPSKQHVERSIIINAPQETVFEMANDLEKFVQYSPFAKEDPGMTMEWGTKRSGLGASYSWKGNKTGQGTMTITESRPPEYISNDLDFKKEGKAKGFFKFEKVDGGTKVTWGFDGDSGMNIAKRYMGLLVMDKFLGAYFERGLASMKDIAEAQKDAAPKSAKKK